MLRVVFEGQIWEGSPFSRVTQTQAAQVAKRLVDEFKDADDATEKKLHYEALNRFKASDGWLRGWERRYDVRWGKLSGEPASVYMEVVAQGREDPSNIGRIST